MWTITSNTSCNFDTSNGVGVWVGVGVTTGSPIADGVIVGGYKSGGHGIIQISVPAECSCSSGLSKCIIFTPGWGYAII